MWFSLTRPCGMKRAVAQVSWGNTEARLHRAFVRTLNLVQREHEPLKDFKQEKDMFIFSVWKDHPDHRLEEIRLKPGRPLRNLLTNVGEK